MSRRVEGGGLARAARPDQVAVGVAATAALAWGGVVAIGRSSLMMGGAAPFLAAWLVMMTAMMLPSALPLLRMHGRTAATRGATVSLAAGYLLVWTGVGAVAWALARLASLGPDAFARPAAAAALAAAAAVQLSPFKSACLRRCRSPLAFLLRAWRPGRAGAARMGAEHGLWCVGCCVAPMLALLALGVMNLAVMVAVSLLVLAEKTAPFGVALSRALPAALAGLAVAVALDPAVYGALT